MFLDCVRKGIRFSPRLPLGLRAWAHAWSTACDGALLLDIVLTGFRVSPWRRSQIVARTFARLAWAMMRVLVGRDARLIYADREILVLDGVPVWQWIESVGPPNLTRVVWSGAGPPGVMPDLPTTPAPPAAPDAPAQPPWPRGTILTRV